MKRNFYLQHPLMAMHDPRMQYLLKMEKLKGTGAYWFVIEKLAMLPGSCVDMEFLRPYCKMHKISFAYVKKIILGYELFDFEEDGSFAPAELNPLHKPVQKREETVADKTGKPEDSVRKTVPKTTGNVSESSVSWSKNDEKRQKTSREKAEKRTEKSYKTLNDSIISESVDTDNKENIKDILTTAAEEKERNTAAADFSNVESRRTDAAACCTVATVQRSQCHTSPLPVPHFSVPNAALHTCSSVAFHPFKCGIGDAEVWHSGGSSARFAFIATTVHGSDSKILLCRPEADGSIRVFRSLYSLGNNIFRIGGIHRVSVRAVDDVGRYITFVVVRGGHPTEVDVSIRQSSDSKMGRGCRWHVVYPGHGRLQGRSGIKVLFQYIIQPLCVVHQIFHTIMGLTCQFVGTDEVHLTLHFIQCPVSFTGIEEIDTQSGNDLATITLFLPVESKG